MVVDNNKTRQDNNNSEEIGAYLNPEGLSLDQYLKRISHELLYKLILKSSSVEYRGISRGNLKCGTAQPSLLLCF